MASQPPPPTPLPAPGPGSPLHLVEPPQKPAKVELPKPAPAPPRQPIVDLGVTKRTVKAGLVILERELRKGAPDEKTQEFYAALRELHLDGAGAEFDSGLLLNRLQGRELVGSRAGEEPLP